jgi:glycosyltransferase involved in cell wall biosynthesis
VSEPLVTVVIGTYRREAYIRRTLDSVFAQDWPALQIIVVDDASDDRTVDILREYGDRIELVVLPENSRRPAVPRNVALKRARGEFIAFLDSDDLWKPGKIRRQVEHLQANPDLMLLHGNSENIDLEDRSLGVRHGGVLPDDDDKFLRLLEHCFISISTVMVRRAVLDTVGLLDEDPFYRAKEDYEWFLRIAHRHPIAALPDVLACYRKAPTGISAEEGNWHMRPEDAPMHLRILQRPELWEGRTDRAFVRRIFLEACLVNAMHWRGQGRPARALWFCRLGLSRAPVAAALWQECAKSIVRILLPRKVSP